MVKIHKFEVYISTPDDDGDYRVEIISPDKLDSIEYSTDLDTILPTSDDFKRYMDRVT